MDEYTYRLFSLKTLKHELWRMRGFTVWLHVVS